MGIFRQFPYTNFHDLNEDWIIEEIKRLTTEWFEYNNKWESFFSNLDDAIQSVNELNERVNRIESEITREIATYINNYFNTIDITPEIKSVLDKMIKNGSLDNTIKSTLSPTVTEWLNENITEPTGIVIDRSLTVAGACADAKSTGDAIASMESAFNTAETNLTREPLMTTWSRFEIRDNGSAYASLLHIASGYMLIINENLVFEAPIGYEYKIFQYSSASASNFEKLISNGYVTGKNVYTVPNGKYIRVCLKKVNETEINIDDSLNIKTQFYNNYIKQLAEVNNESIKNISQADSISAVWEQGGLNPANGGSPTAVAGNRIRTSYIMSPTNMEISIDIPDNMCVMLFYYTSQTVASFVDVINGGYLTKSVKITIPKGQSFRIVAGYLNNADISPSAGDNIEIKCLKTPFELNVLCIGNSFSMDSFAYLPVILKDALPKYTINCGVAYQSSANIQKHIDMYNNDQKYTLYYEWNQTTNRWVHYTSTGTVDRGKTLRDIIKLNKWDIIYVQPASSVIDQEAITNNIIIAGNNLLRILQSIATKPFKYLMGTWLGTDRDGDHGDEVYLLIVEAIKRAMKETGINGFIPIGGAIQNARSIPSLQALGTTGNMLYDGQHMQSGIAPLIAGYTIAQYIINSIEPNNINGETFIPTTDNCIEINAWHETGVTPMTHGQSVGATADNVKIAQSISAMAIKYPYEITDCNPLV